jgi:hypothetical protein
MVAASKPAFRSSALNSSCSSLVDRQRLHRHRRSYLRKVNGSPKEAAAIGAQKHGKRVANVRYPAKPPPRIHNLSVP